MILNTVLARKIKLVIRTIVCDVCNQKITTNDESKCRETMNSHLIQAHPNEHKKASEEWRLLAKQIIELRRQQSLTRLYHFE